MVSPNPDVVKTVTDRRTPMKGPGYSSAAVPTRGDQRHRPFYNRNPEDEILSHSPAVARLSSPPIPTGDSAPDVVPYSSGTISSNPPPSPPPSNPPGLYLNGLGDDIQRLQQSCVDIVTADRKVVEIMARFDKKADQSILIQTLFSPLVWGDSYDEDMHTHAEAIDRLISLVVRLDTTPRLSKKPIFKAGGVVEDIGGGSGTVESLIDKSFCGLSLSDRVRSLRFRLLDLSDHMMALAKRKVGGRGLTVDFAKWDLLDAVDNASRQALFPPSDRNQAPQVIILSQVLPFIIDRDAARLERQGHKLQGLPHTVKRIQVFNALAKALADDGYLMIIDEDPPSYTMETTTARQVLQARLFRGTSQLMQQSELLRAVLKNMETPLRFLAQFETPIDHKHRMYVMLYRKEPSVTIKLGGESVENRDVRDRAVQSIVDEFASLGDQSQALGPTKSVRSPEDLKPGDDDVRYGKIILKQVLHSYPEWRVRALIDRAINMLVPGGELLVVDEFDAPKSSDHAMRNSQFRQTLMPRFGDRVTFQGVINKRLKALPIQAKKSKPTDSFMFGYLYTKNSCPIQE